MDTLTDYRCACGRLLFKGQMRAAHIEIKCRRCGTIGTFDADPSAGAYQFPAKPIPLVRDASATDEEMPPR